MNSSNPYTENQNFAFDLSDLFVFLWQKKIRIIFTTMILLLAGGYYVVKLPKFYTASSTLLLGGKEKGFSLPSSMVGFSGGDGSKMTTYMEFMRSKRFIESVVLNLELQKSREFRPAVTFGTDLEQLQHSIRVFLQNLSLMPIADTELLKVSFTSYSPSQAAKVVNYFGPAFFTFYAEKGKKKADDASLWLNNQLSQLEDKLAEADISLQEFMRENRLMDITSQLELARTEISALLAEKLMNEKTIAGYESIYQQVQSFDNDYPALMQNAYFLQNPLVINMRGKIVAQRQVLAELSKRYKSKHHKYIAANTALEGFNQELESLLDNLISNLEQIYQTHSARRETLIAQIEAIKSDHSELGKHELQLERLRREVGSTQKLYEVFLARLQETEILKDLGNTEDFIVVDNAEDPRVPSKPKVRILLSVLAIFSIFISIAFWLALHFVADKKSRLKKLLQKHGVVVLGELPKPAKVKKTKNKSTTNKKPPSKSEILYAEAVRSLRSELMVRTDDVPLRTIMISSVQPAKLRSKLAIDLAECFGDMEKSILLDADLRNPQIGNEYGVEQIAPGLTNFMSRKISFSDATIREKGCRLTIMPSGSVPSDPLVYLSKNRFGDFVKKLGVLFERVIVETPPINGFSDALVVSKLVDGVVLLCDLEVVESAELLEAIQRLQDSGSPLLGVVFEKAKNVKSKIPNRGKGKSHIKQVVNY
jgi:succinoglycan biosynthesis transport protein ExoP